MTNPNCDGDKCRSSKGQVRKLPIDGDGNLILCRVCFDHEILFRVERNIDLGTHAQFDTPSWKDLEVYGT